MNWSLTQDIAGSREVVIILMVMYILIDTFVDYLATAVKLLIVIIIFDKLQWTAIWNSCYLLKISMDYFFWWLCFTQLLWKFWPYSTITSVKNVEMALLKTIIEILYNYLTLFVVTFKFWRNESWRIINLAYLNFVSISLNDWAKWWCMF